MPPPWAGCEELSLPPREPLNAFKIHCCQQPQKLSLHCSPSASAAVAERMQIQCTYLLCTRRTQLHLVMPAKPVLVFQLHNGLHSSVVVVQVDSPHHLGPLQVPNFHCHLTDGVTANELYNLLGRGVPCVHFNGRQLDILNTGAHKTTQ